MRSSNYNATADVLLLGVDRSIIGLSDGLTVPFALTTGLSSIGSSRIVVLGGVAELIAGAISMGIGGFRKWLLQRDPRRPTCLLFTILTRVLLLRA